MTLFEILINSEITEPGWNYQTLRPPLSFKEIIIDINYQWFSYCKSKISFFKRIKFLVLRIFQRVAYNLGWILITKRCKKVAEVDSE
ncbi:MAG: hypothetical protein GF353_15980 [Candidatus Lokiarchaeota archaeon]|nr:hypothetical protein [Candidatus Lokiarchaeota archaeon]